MPNSELVCIGSFSNVVASNLKQRLQEQGILSEVRPCTGPSCSSKTELWVNPNQPELIQKILHKEFSKTYEGLEFDPQIVNKVFDEEQATAVCPACATEFSTKSLECPECGLCFG